MKVQFVTEDGEAVDVSDEHLKAAIAAHCKMRDSRRARFRRHVEEYRDHYISGLWFSSEIMARGLDGEGVASRSIVLGIMLCLPFGIHLFKPLRRRKDRDANKS